MRSLLKLLRYFVQYHRITLQKFQSGVTKDVDYLCLLGIEYLNVFRSVHFYVYARV
jgi:hypothetical protein